MRNKINLHKKRLRNFLNHGRMQDPKIQRLMRENKSMRIELTEQVNVEMYLVALKSGVITPIDVIRVSESGNTVETNYGQRYRTDTKTHKVFHKYQIALIASKAILKQFDEEYDYLLSKNGLSPKEHRPEHEQ